MLEQDHKPIKGILKNTASFENEQKRISSHHAREEKEMKWDELNILATYHPENKDYGYDKIKEPATPFNRNSYGDSDEEVTTEVFDPEELAYGLQTKCMPKIFDEKEEDDNEDEGLTDEQKEHKKDFLSKRKQHYNEFEAMKLARQLLQQDDDEENNDNNRDNDDNDVFSDIQKHDAVSSDCMELA